MTPASPHFQRVVTGTALAALLTVGLAMGGWVLLIMVVAVASLALLEF
nr:phosphatidate cytidylyl transferase [Desulfovibrio vulgaris] [Nitratidesulfovibrio vulgaris str. 'Miyazaki F']